MAVILFAGFAVLHTVLASKSFKEKLVISIGEKIAFFRLFYNLFSILFVYAIWEFSPKISTILYDLQFPYDIIIFVIQVLGMAGFIWTLFYFDGLEFLGIRQIIRYANNKYNKDDGDERKTFIVAGPFKFVRHPLYLFSIIFLSARPSMSLFYFVVLFSAVIYFIIGAQFEEKKLENEFGQIYSDYKKKVPFLIPIKFGNKF